MVKSMVVRNIYLVLRSILCLLLACSVTIGLVNAAGRAPLEIRLPRAEVPQGAEAQWIAEKMVLNGLAMSIRHFRYKGELEQVRDYYTDTWSRLGCPALTELNQPPGYMLGCESNDYYFSVRLQEAGREIEGVVTISELPSSAIVNRNTKFPKLKSTQVLQKVESRDFGKTAETLLLISPKSLEMNMDYVDHQLLQIGWTQEDVTQSVNQNDYSVTKIYNKRKQTIQIVYRPTAGDLGGTQMWVNWVK